MFELLIQFLVLGATAALFWIARRDLASRTISPPMHSTEKPDTAELEQLCATLEALVTDLSRRLAALEERETAPGTHPADKSATLPPLLAEPRPLSPKRLERGEQRVHREVGSAAGEVSSPQYAPVYALMDAGVADPQEIARRTGLSRGEVDLILSLRARQVL